jgi:glycosyltransferase involved in cell wall biosynthesis
VLAGPCDERIREVESSYISKVDRLVARFDEQVQVTGAIDYVPDLFQASDVFVLPSYAEGMPNVLLEAMSTGLPCLATRIPGIQDLIKNEKTGLLVDPVEVEELEKGLRRLIANSALRKRLGYAARQRIESGYSIAVTARQYVQLFQKVCS